MKVTVKALLIDALRQKELDSVDIEMDQSSGKVDRAAIERLAAERGYRLQAVSRLADKSRAWFAITLLPAEIGGRSLREVRPGRPVTRGGRPVEVVPTTPTVAAKRRSR